MKNDNLERAAYGEVLSGSEKGLGVALISIGRDATSIFVHHNHVVHHTAIIPFGGNIITEDIRQGCGISQRQAEQMKTQYGYCYSDLAPSNKTIIVPGIGDRKPREISFKTLACIIEARMSEIMDAVMYEIRKSGYANKLQAGVVLTGGGAQLACLSQYVNYRTGFNSRIAQTPSDKSLLDKPFIDRPLLDYNLKLIPINEELKRFFSRHPEKLYDLPSRKFEELIADILKDFGFDVELTSATRDGGFDIYAYLKTQVGNFLTYVECKKWTPPNHVGIGVIQRLHGVQHINNTNKSMIVTTSYFTEPAIIESRRYSNLMTLVDYEDLKKWLENYH